VPRGGRRPPWNGRRGQARVRPIVRFRGGIPLAEAGIMRCVTAPGQAQPRKIDSQARKKIDKRVYFSIALRRPMTGCGSQGCGRGAMSEQINSPGLQDGASYGGAIDRISATEEAAVMRKAGRRREDRIVAVSAATQRAVERAILAARGTQPVLVTGPPGAGKSMLARAVHAWSADAGAPIETLSCAAVPEPLQARALFGCVAGAYPALPEAFVGAIERATGGTLLLEGIDALAPAVRSALARALAQGVFRPEGGGDELAVRARIVATADREL